MFDGLGVGRLVGGDIGDLPPVGAPGEGIDAVLGGGNADRVATLHRHDEDLGLLFVLVLLRTRVLAAGGLGFAGVTGICGFVGCGIAVESQVVGQKGEPAAVRRPGRRREARALPGQGTPGTSGHVDEVDLLASLVALPVRRRDDHRNLATVRGDPGIAQAHQSSQVLELEARRRRHGQGQRGPCQGEDGNRGET